MLQPPARGVVLVAAALLAAGCAAERPVPATAGLPVPPDAQEAMVVRLTDGDTVQLRGRGSGPLSGDRTRVRILLVDTPEVFPERECLGPEAADRTAELLPAGSAVRVQADRDPQDRFGRSLLHVWNADGVHVGEALVREGLATVLQIDPNERYLEVLEDAEAAAREAGRGLWSACR